MQQIANALQVPPTFFFDGLPGPSPAKGHSPMPEYISEMLATQDGAALVKAFMQIKSVTLMRSIVHLVEELAVSE
jgi:hypothetical protein